MRFYKNDTRTATVAYFFTDAPFIPYSTPFRSRWWATTIPQDEDGLGEDLNVDTTYRNGSEVGDGPGIKACGSADQWRNGQDNPPPVPTPLDAEGTPACCGGIPVVTVPCVSCPAGTGLPTYTLTPTSIMDAACNQCVMLNAPTVLTFDGSCTWVGPTIAWCAGSSPARWIMRVSGGGVDLQWEQVGFGRIAEYTAGVWDCRSPLTFNKIFPFGPPILCAWPATLSLSP
jgi:hypothetical protein